MSLALLGIGILIGAMIDEDAKGEAIDDLRKTAIKLLSKPDEKERIVWEIKRYKEHRKKQDEQDRIVTDEEVLKQKKELLQFKTFAEAALFKTEMITFVTKRNDNRLTMCDLGKLRGKAMPYTWDNYGWDFDQIDDSHVANFAGYSELIICDPKILDISKE